jgi:hypothetical protein
MKTKDELRSELESEVKILRKYFDDVTISDDEINGCLWINISDKFRIRSIEHKYKTFPPRGEVCLVWDGDNIMNATTRISLGDGTFVDYRYDLNADEGFQWNNWKSLGVNILDKIKEQK